MYHKSPSEYTDRSISFCQLYNFRIKSVYTSASPGAPVSSTNKTGHHDITEISLKVALNTINQTKPNE
jgi:hypothetical protein